MGQKMGKAYTTAFKLLVLGFSVVPSGSGDKHKAPLVNWRNYQSTAPDEGKLETWESELKPSLWGIVTNDRVAVIDADTPEAREELEAALGPPHVATPRGGAHWYFDTTGHPVKTVAGLLPGIDVRGVGGFVNIAGGKYKILRLPVPGDTLLPWGKLPKRILAALDGGKPRPKAPHGEAIPETTRNATLTSIGGAMRRQGADQSTIEVALQAENAKRCRPPLPEHEVSAIAQSVSRYEPKPGADQPAHFNLTDYGNAERLVSLYGDDIRYSPERKSWLIWTGKVWEWDMGGVRIAKLAKKTARNIYREAADESDDDIRKELVKHARATERQVRIDAMIKSAESEPGIAVKLADLDANHWFLNVNNGTMDLKIGVLKSHDRTNLITEIIPVNYDAEATSTEWGTFLHRIFNGDADLIAYIQRALGYSITGDQSEQVFFFCHGSGFNGKSTLLNACRLVLGNYAHQIPPTAFMIDKNKRGGPDEAISSLKNKRLVCSTELEDGQRLSVSLVKRMTGGEPLWCEHKFERGYNFQPTHKLWLSGNHEPVITDTTNSIWYRLKKIPFTVEIPEAVRQKSYAEYLAKEHGTAILTWLVRGCVEWQQTGTLGEPEAVKQAVAEYRDQQDILHDYLKERCIFQKSATIDQKDLYANYKQWAEENDVPAIGKRTFRSRILEKGVVAAIGNRNIKIWRGIRLRIDSDEDVTPVTSVTDFSESSLREASTGKTLLKTGNKSNKSNPDNPRNKCENPSEPVNLSAKDDIWVGMPDYPSTPCPICGCPDYWQDFKAKRNVCAHCQPRPEGGDQ